MAGAVGALELERTLVAAVALVTHARRQHDLIEDGVVHTLFQPALQSDAATTCVYHGLEAARLLMVWEFPDLLAAISNSSCVSRAGRTCSTTLLAEGKPSQLVCNGCGKTSGWREHSTWIFQRALEGRRLWAMLESRFEGGVQVRQA